MKVFRLLPQLLLGLVLHSARVGAADYDFAAMIQPVPETARFSDPGYIVWCGSMIRGEDGKYHLFYSRWPEKLGHYAWVTSSEVAHAVSETPFGPFRFADVTLPARGAGFWDGLCTHNPTITRFGGKYYLYYMGNTGDGKQVQGLNWSHRNNQRIGVAVADSPDGPWTRMDQPLIGPTEGFHDALCMANPSVTQRPDGGYLMVYKAVGLKKPMPFGGPVVHLVAMADKPTGPFRKLPDPVFTMPGSSFAAEDPFVWRGPDRYWAIVKDFKGGFSGTGKTSLALFESGDGIGWKPAKHPLVSGLELPLADGNRLALEKLERPQLLFNDKGEPAVLICAAAPAGHLSKSFSVQIPLNASMGEGTAGKPDLSPNPSPTPVSHP